MSVYERSWRRWAGRPTPLGTRFLVITRYALGEAFASRLFVAFYVLCTLPTAVGLLFIYLANNVELLQRLGLTGELSAGLTVAFFRVLFGWQAVPAFFLAVIVSPGLVSPDLKDNALSLYLSRPIDRPGYVLGKMAVLAALLSPVTWIAGLAALGLQSALAGGAWWRSNLRIGVAYVVGHLAWIVVISLVTLAISAWVRHRPVARGALFGLFFVLGAVAATVNGTTGTSWGDLVNLPRAMYIVTIGMFDPGAVSGLPAPAAWLSLAVFSGLSIALLAAKLRAHEVVR